MGTRGLAAAMLGHGLPARPGPRLRTHSPGAPMMASQEVQPGNPLSAELTPHGEGTGSRSAPGLLGATGLTQRSQPCQPQGRGPAPRSSALTPAETECTPRRQGGRADPGWPRAAGAGGREAIQTGLLGLWASALC